MGNHEAAGLSSERRHSSCSSLDWQQRNIKGLRYCPFVRGIHQWPMDSPHIGTVMHETFPFDNVIMSVPSCFLKLHISDHNPSLPGDNELNGIQKGKNSVFCYQIITNFAHAITAWLLQCTKFCNDNLLQYGLIVFESQNVCESVWVKLISLLIKTPIHFWVKNN